MGFFLWNNFELAGDIDDAFFFVPSLDLPSIPLPSFAASAAATCIQRVFRGTSDIHFLSKRLKQFMLAGHVSRLKLILSELRVPWKEYLRNKREEEERSRDFKIQADGAYVLKQLLDVLFIFLHLFSSKFVLND